MYRNAVLADKNAKVDVQTTARKLFCTYPTACFVGKYDDEFDVLDRVALYAKVPINCILVAGSAQTGESFVKKTPFTPTGSDLDLAIVNQDLFSRMIELTNKATRGFRDLSKFERRDNKDTAPAFLENLGRGFFRPDLMPACEAKTQWFDFFRAISSDYRTQFTSINAGVYATLALFEYQRVNDIEAARDD